MSVDRALDMISPEARRELVRFIRDHNVPLQLRESLSAAFALGYGIGVEETGLKVADDARRVREQCEALRSCVVPVVDAAEQFVNHWEARRTLAHPGELVRFADHPLTCPLCGSADPKLDDENRIVGWQHHPECAWLALPRMVAVLEAVEEARRDLRFLDLPAFREDHLAVLSLADRVRAALRGDQEAKTG